MLNQNELATIEATISVVKNAEDEDKHTIALFRARDLYRKLSSNAKNAEEWETVTAKFADIIPLFDQLS